MSHTRLTPREAVSRLWMISHTLDELSVLTSQVSDGEDGHLASTLMLLASQTGDCAEALHVGAPIVDLPGVEMPECKMDGFSMP